MLIVGRNIFLFWLIVLPLGINGSTSVKMTNILDGNLNLTVHCKSQDLNDFGVHLLHQKQSYQFSSESYTLIFCSFSWNGACHWFNIFNQNRVLACDNKDCSWNIKQSGPCVLVNPPLCYSWRKETC
ncbi:uncharacterized protein DS421_14g472600 [Arachis hypogaea]|nr:uncharacterized protein DS421_14g472600 [Arachis hypogaea]